MRECNSLSGKKHTFEAATTASAWAVFAYNLIEIWWSGGAEVKKKMRREEKNEKNPKKHNVYDIWECRIK
jgi:hypothetical protein